jgi:organic hydroperoxide reductase OsmC/OhrA
MAIVGKEHGYATRVVWTGDLGTGTSGYRAYSRNYDVVVDGKATILGSSDPVFRGDRTRHNPEELLVAALSSCHLLSYLHMCADAGVVVTGYVDDAVGTMAETADGGGHFTSVTLRPRVTIAPGSDRELALRLHDRAHHLCFIASSVNFPVACEPTVEERPVAAAAET